MVFDFDLRLFCENLKATKPPYECPAPGCNRVYKTYIGIQFHLFNYNHENPDGKSSSAPANSGQQKHPDALKKGHHRQARCPSSPSRVSQEESEHELSSSSLSPHNVSSKSQRVVEVTLDGRVHRIDVYEPMNVQVRQSQESRSCKSVESKPSEVVGCTTVPIKTTSDEPPPDATVIGDAVPVSDTRSSLTADVVATSGSLETASKHHVADTPVENVADIRFGPKKMEISCDDQGCDDTKASSVSKATFAADSTADGFALAAEHLPSDICTVKDILSTASDSATNDAATIVVKNETTEEHIKPSVECCDKNIPCCDDADNTALLNTSTISTSCAKSAECHTASSCNSTSIAVVSDSAPSKLSLPSAEFKILSDYVRPPKISATAQTSEYYKFTERTSEELDTVVEYDMDEEVYILLFMTFVTFVSFWFFIFAFVSDISLCDLLVKRCAHCCMYCISNFLSLYKLCIYLQDYIWLELANEQRQVKSLAAVTHEVFEALMDRFEKEAFFRTRSSLSPSRGLSISIDDDAVCAICMDGECQNANVILFCDLCNLAVHQVSCLHIL